MPNLPVHSSASAGDASGGCGTSCGAGLEKIYPTVAVRYGAMRWIGEFEVKPGAIFKCGARMVIKSPRGIELGEQVSLTCNGCSKSVSREQMRKYVEASGPEFYEFRAGRVLREATPQDISENEHLNRHVREDIDRAQLLAAQLGLDLKIVTCEHLLGGERIVFYFRSEGRVDFRELVRELVRHYQTRIEMRQVGARDEARLVADYEVCGRECCCRNFLKKLRPVNMKMAKLQKSTLDPSKVSGRCGRLRCCLRYEHEGYEVLAAKLPAVGSWVDSDFGLAQVVDRQILTQLVLVRSADGREVTIPAEELKALNVAPPARSPSADGAVSPRAESTPTSDRPPARRPPAADRAMDEGGPPPREAFTPEEPTTARAAGDRNGEGAPPALEGRSDYGPTRPEDMPSRAHPPSGERPGGPPARRRRRRRRRGGERPPGSGASDPDASPPGPGSM